MVETYCSHNNKTMESINMLIISVVHKMFMFIHDLSHVPLRVWKLLLVPFVFPSLFFYGVLYLLPRLDEAFDLSTWHLWLHIVVLGFLLINILGNLYLLDDNGYKEPVTALEPSVCCRNLRQREAWWCSKCNECVLDKKPVTISNISHITSNHFQRHYILSFGYTSTMMLQLVILNLVYLSTMCASKVKVAFIVISTFQPLLKIVGDPLSYADFQGLVTAVLMMGYGWAGSTFLFHFTNALRGVTEYERIRGQRGSMKMWRQNICKTLGVKWKRALLWPFAFSPLPGQAPRSV